MILVSAVLSQYTGVTDDRQTNDDRQHLIPIAKLAMQLQRSDKNWKVVSLIHRRGQENVLFVKCAFYQYHYYSIINILRECAVPADSKAS